MTTQRNGPEPFFILKKKNVIKKGLPARVQSFKYSRELIEETLVELFKGSPISWKFHSPKEMNDKTFQTGKHRDWNNKENRPTIDTLVWERDHVDRKIRIRFCLIEAGDATHGDKFRNRPDHSKAFEEQTLEDVYNYWTVNNIHFCVMSMCGKEVNNMRRFAAFRYDDFPITKYGERNKYEGKKLHYVYSKTGMLNKYMYPVGSEHQNIIRRILELIKNQYRNGN